MKTFETFIKATVIFLFVTIAISTFVRLRWPKVEIVCPGGNMDCVTDSIWRDK